MINRRSCSITETTSWFETVKRIEQSNRASDIERSWLDNWEFLLETITEDASFSYTIDEIDQDIVDLNVYDKTTFKESRKSHHQ